MAIKLEVKNTACGYESKIVIKNISFEVNTGEILSILGPNGVGKTTLFKTILGFLKPKNGQILLNGQDVSSWSRKSFAKSIGYVPQAHVPPFPYKVIDVVVMGRTAHMGAFSSPSRKDIEIAEEVIDSLNITYLKDRIYTEISGGERQLVLVARALAQKPEILIMDEPTSNLDFGNQVKVLSQIKRLAKSNIGIIMTSHFPDHAFISSTKVVAIGREGMFCIGSPDEVITEERLKKIYGVDVRIRTFEDDNMNKTKVCIPVIEN